MSDICDRWQTMFDMQAELNRRIGVDSTALPKEEKTQWVLNYCRALQQEVAELVDSVPWKWWAHYQELDMQNARVEVVDMLHFLISLAQVLDMTAEDVYALYQRKHSVNHTRQNEGYTQKTETDNQQLT